MILPGSVGRDLLRLNANLTILSSGRPYFYDRTIEAKVEIPNAIKGVIEKVNPEYASFLKLKMDFAGTAVKDKGGAPLWTLPPDGQALFLREWYGYDVNQLVYLDQHLVDIAVRVPAALTSMNKRSGEARKADLMGELRQAYAATWICFKAQQWGYGLCSPPSRLSVPALSPPPTGSHYASILNRAQPLGELNLRPKGWKPRLNFPILYEEVAFP